MIFSKTFVEILVILALVGISLSTITLLWLVVKDIRTKKLW